MDSFLGPEATAVALAAKLPVYDLKLLALKARNGAGALTDLQSRAGSAALREACTMVLQCLGGTTTEYMAGCLAGAANAFGQINTIYDVDVVWTGPESDVETTRLTSAVVSELIGQAERELLFVSYATFPERAVLDALEDACRRGVDTTMVLERHDDNPSYVGTDHGLAQLPVRRVVWPRAKRPPGAALHPKLVVVDRRVALVGSANLTSAAFEVNMECGVLLRGGPWPRSIVEHIWDLVRRGTMIVLAPSTTTDSA